MFKILSVFNSELRKYLCEVKAYYPDHIVNIVVTYIFFTAFFLGFSKGEAASGSYYIGFVCWFFTNNIISEASVSISFEKQVGTFSQLLVKPVSIEALLTIRTTVWFSVSLIEAIILMVLVKLTLPITISFNILIVPVILITLVGIWGLGFILAGLTLLYTKTASFDSIISYALLFLTGALIDISKLPEFIQKIGYIIPLSLGIKISKAIIDNTAIYSRDILLLVVNSIIYLFIGIFFFKYTMYKSKQKGIITHY